MECITYVNYLPEVKVTKSNLQRQQAVAPLSKVQYGAMEIGGHGRLLDIVELGTTPNWLLIPTRPNSKAAKFAIMESSAQECKNET